MSTPALSGSWTYRSFNPTYVTGNLTPQEDALILWEAAFNFETPTRTTLRGAIEGPGGRLDLTGTVGRVDWSQQPLLEAFIGGELVSFDIVGTGRPDSTGRPGTGTDGWEYRYHGHLTPYGYLMPHWPDRVGTPVIVGSVFRAKTHNGNPPRSPAGYVASFIAVKQRPFQSELSGSWTYRSFHNYTEPVYQTAPQKAQPTADELIWQEAVFRFEAPTSDALPLRLQGAIEGLGGGLDLKGTVWPGYVGGEPPRFTFVSTERLGTETEYYYQGHLTRHWEKGVDQRAALVGSVIRAKSHGEAAPAGYVAPFIAVKQPPSP